MKKSKIRKLKVELGLSQQREKMLHDDIDHAQQQLSRVNQENTRLSKENARLREEEIKVEMNVDTEFEELSMANPGYPVKTYPAQHTVNLLMTYKGWQYRFIGYKFDGKEMAND